MPTFHKWAGRTCEGVQLHVTDRNRFKPFLTSLAMIATARGAAPRAFAWKPPPYEFEHRRLPIDILCGTDHIRQAMERGEPLTEIKRRWQPALVQWKHRRAPALLYR